MTLIHRGATHLTGTVRDGEPIVVGWREWGALPELGVPAIKIKVDSGARTSALHAFRVDPFEERGRRRVRFAIHPLQNRPDIEIECKADIFDERVVTDSGGHREERIVIITLLKLGEHEWPIEVSLTGRATMRYRMLLGRTAMDNRLLIDPCRSYLAGKPPKLAYPKKRKTKRKS